MKRWRATLLFSCSHENADEPVIQGISVEEHDNSASVTIIKSQIYNWIGRDLQRAALFLVTGWSCEAECCQCFNPETRPLIKLSGIRWLFNLLQSIFSSAAPDWSKNSNGKTTPARVIPAGIRRANATCSPSLPPAVPAQSPHRSCICSRNRQSFICRHNSSIKLK